jgi:hypothetical protein
MSFDIILIIVSSVFLGISINRWWSSLINNRDKKKKINNKNKKFEEILNNLKSTPVSAKFNNRLNTAVYIETNLTEKGKVDLIYFIDKNDIAVFKDDDCLYTSEDVDKKIIDEIIVSIIKRFDNEINDVVSVLGITFSRKDFEKTFGVKTEDIKKLLNFQQNESEIDKIYFENEMKYDIDEILDRINIVGIHNLTKSELEFLRKYGKNE